MRFFRRKKDETPEPPSPDEIDAISRAFEIRDKHWKLRSQLLTNLPQHYQAELKKMEFFDQQWIQEEIELTKKGEIQK